MKIKRKLIHILPLSAILGVSGLAIVGTATIKNHKNANADTAVSMTISGDLNFTITPEVGGTYAEKTIGVTVETTNATGYTLYMASKSATPSATSTGSEGTISSVTSPVSKTNMPINSWGYYIGSGDVNPIPDKDNAVAIRGTTSASNDNNKTTNVTVGVKVAPTIKSGSYGDTLSFTATANPACEDGFFCISTMQEMTPAVCAATMTPLNTAREVTYVATNDNTKIPRTTLTDTRDNKTYLVSKFADGSCWMSQSLELELSTNTTLTSADTDLNSKSSWTPNKSTSNDIADFNAPDPDDIPSDDEKYKAVSVRPETKYLRNGITPAATASTNDGKSEWEKVGYYYSNTAATAGSNKDAFDTYDEYEYTALDSICPKGWRLPYSDYYSGREDLYYFGEEYDPYYVNIVNESFGFIASGWIVSDVSGSGLNWFGNEGTFWLAEVESWTSNAHYMYVESTGTPGSWTPFYGNSFYNSGDYIMNGLQIRCIARD
jgi:hypothetical protein